MRAIQVTRHGGPEVMELADLPTPTPGPGEVRLKVRAAGVNFVDTYLRMGRYPSKPPYVPGTEAAGVVDAVGPGVVGVEIGAPMVYAQGPGSYAESVVIATSNLVPVPPGVELETAAAVLLQGMTAHYLCNDTFPVRAGDPVLIHAAAGGVGLLLTQMCRAKGALVIATVSTGEKAILAKEAGAHHVVRYDREDFSAEVARITREANGTPGAAVVFDGVGQATFARSLDSLRPRGLLALFGAASGPVPPFELQTLATKGSLFITRPSMGAYIAGTSALLGRAGAVLGLVAAGSLKVRVGHRLPLARAQEAHRDLEARRTTGKVLLIP